MTTATAMTATTATTAASLDIAELKDINFFQVFVAQINELNELLRRVLFFSLLVTMVRVHELFPFLCAICTRLFAYVQVPCITSAPACFTTIY